MKLKLDVQVEADSFRVLTSLVEEGLGYALLPPSSVRHEVADGRLEIAAISNPAPIRELTIASPPSTTRARQLSLITSLLRDEVGACRAEGLWDIDLT
jgi:LysR family nitrogen assimilation transcriptional regulator